jgi:formylglycine-generating enzyme required for sulfatase activity
LSEYQGVPVNPNFPAVFLDWFDAYAYAKWRGRELPTEQEWEKAARGTDGRIYPWGDLSVKGWANLLESADHPAGWREIGSFKNDKSPYGVLDMAGNVSEWTESLDEMGNPIVRGGNFRNSDGRTIRRVTGISGHTQDERIGFRTIHRFPQ